MRIFEPRMWTMWDIACVKWSSILFGAIAGAYFADFVMTYVWFFVIGMVVLAVRPIMLFLGTQRPRGGQPRAMSGTLS